jgi:G3E family GTPase
MDNFLILELRIMAMDVIALLGPLGSGKTTTLNELIPHVPLGDSYAVVVNDVGAQNIDARRIEDHPANRAERILALTAGCIGCSDVTQFKEALNRVSDAKIDLLFIEPTGIAPGNEIVDVITGEGFNLSVMTLVNYGSIERDMKWQVLPSQIAVADLIGITHSGDEEKKLDVIEHALDLLPPMDVDTAIQIINRGDINSSLLAHLRGLGKQYKLGSSICGHSCEIDHHDHSDQESHDHGITAQSLALQADLTPEILKDILMPLLNDAENPLLRAKGRVGVYEFDIAGFTWNQCIADSESSGNTANVIFAGGKPPKGIEQLYSVIDDRNFFDSTADKKQIVKSIGELSKEDRTEIVLDRIDQYPNPISAIHGELITDCEADEGYEIAFWPLDASRDDLDYDVKARAMSAYVEFRLSGLHELMHHPESIANTATRRDYWMRRYGATLGYNGYYLSEYIDEKNLENIRAANPAKLLAQGFMKLNSLTFDEGRAEEKPEFIYSVMSAAVKNGDLTTEEMIEVLNHGIMMSSESSEHAIRWQKALQETQI